jgi:hypothetical protein
MKIGEHLAHNSGIDQDAASAASEEMGEVQI